MQAGSTDHMKGDVWFVYDGDCPICRMSAHALQIRKSVGKLHLVNARTDLDHPVLREVRERGMDLDEGMVLKFGGRFYHGDDALYMTALLGSPHGWKNRINAALFRHKWLARICYPSMRGARSVLLAILGIEKLHNLDLPDDTKPPSDRA